MPTQSVATDNRHQFPPAQLNAYRGQWVGFSNDGSRVLVAGTSELDLVRKAEAQGLSPADYIIEPVPLHDTTIL
jgi:hypothetical protein